MDRELIKRVVSEFLAARIALLPEEDVDSLTDTLMRECTWSASVSAGFDPEKICPQCQGPIEYGLDKCMRCFHLGVLRSYAEQFHQIEATLNEAHQMFSDASAGVQGNPTAHGATIRDLHRWYINLLDILHAITHDESFPSRGPAQIPQRVGSFEEFQRLFGVIGVDDERLERVRRYFETTDTPLLMRIRVEPQMPPEHVDMQVVVNPITEETERAITGEQNTTESELIERLTSMPQALRDEILQRYIATTQGERESTGFPLETPIGSITIGEPLPRHESIDITIDPETPSPTPREWPIDDIETNVFQGQTTEHGLRFLSMSRHDFSFKATSVGRQHHSSGRTSYEITGVLMPFGPERLRARPINATVEIRADHDHLEYCISVDGEIPDIAVSDISSTGALYDGHADALKHFYDHLVNQSNRPDLELPERDEGNEELRDLFIPTRPGEGDTEGHARQEERLSREEMPKIFGLTRPDIEQILTPLPTYLHRRVSSTTYRPAEEIWRVPIMIEVHGRTKEVVVWIRRQGFFNSRHVFQGWVSEHRGIINQPRRLTRRDLDKNANIRRVLFDLLNEARNTLNRRVIGRATDQG